MLRHFNVSEVGELLERDALQKEPHLFLWFELQDIHGS